MSATGVGDKGIPGHLALATTWSAMVHCWSDHDEPAVVAGATVWTGRELIARAAGAAEHLRQITEHAQPLPALLTSTAASFAYVIGGAGTGRPLAPLGPRLTARELGPCLDALDSDVVLAEPQFEDLATELAAPRGLRVVLVGPPTVGDPSSLAHDPAPDAVAYVLHTSGTTGSPKAVPYTQERLAHRVRVHAGLCLLGPGAVYATASPFHHIGGLGNYAVAIAAGAAVVPMPRFTVEAWKGLGELGVTHALTVPTMLEVLLDAQALAVPTLRVLQYGASPIHPDTLRRTLDALPKVDLVNMFGQTEGSPVACLTAQDHRRIALDHRDDLLGSVGRAAPGVEIWIDAPDSSGVGEVFARARHFFLCDPDGVLRTGDLGRIDNDGYLFLVGRRGDRIIRGGENVYPVEVEHVLEQHPRVIEAAIVGVPDQRWGELVKALIVPTDREHPPEIDELRAYARAQLAGFKVPTEWVFTDELPRNATGKLLRRLVATTAAVGEAAERANQ